MKKHFLDYSAQMNCSNKNEYVAKAVHFVNAIDRKNCVSFIDKNDSTFKYNKLTNEFSIIKKRMVLLLHIISLKRTISIILMRRNINRKRKKKMNNRYKPMMYPVCNDFYFSELQDGDDYTGFYCSRCG